jgi:hypothetical protein
MKKFCNIAFSILFAGTLHSSIAMAGGAFNPCELLNKGEAEVLIGEAVNEPALKETKNPLGQKMCLYSTTSSNRLVQISITRTVDMNAKVRENGQSAITIYTTTQQMLSPVEQVSGVGDNAFWGIPGLHILKGEVYILVSVGTTSKPENRDLARKIAEKLIPRL